MNFNYIIMKNIDLKREWTETEFKQVKRKVFSRLKNQLLETRHGKKRFYINSEIDNFFGFAYTSSGAFAGLWLCNEPLYIDFNKTFRVNGFVLDKNNTLFAYCLNDREEEILIQIF